MTLEGKVAIVTGAAHGLGRAIAEQLAADGADIVVADILGDDAAAVAGSLAASGRKAVAVTVDIADERQVDSMVAGAIAEFGRIDILVNNAGIARQRSPVLEMAAEEWDRVVAVNLGGTFLCSRAVGREMVAAGRGGRIVNISSTAGASARVNAAAYCASKAGILQFTRALALELGPHDITVNAVGPGMTLTGSEARLAPSPAYQEAFVAQVPLGRAGQSSDIAQAVAFLVSPAAAYVSGQAIFVDGGYSAGKFSVRD